MPTNNNLLHIIMLGKEALEHEIIDNDTLEGPSYKEFRTLALSHIKTNLTKHVLYDDMCALLYDTKPNKAENVEQLTTILQQIYDEEKDTFNTMNNKIFIVHGHDIEKRDRVEQMLRRIGLEPIILMNEPNCGLALIEKIEAYTDVRYGIILYSACDKGKEKDSHKKYRLRARQNVVFEHGYLLGKLGRKNTVALVEEGVEIPGDLAGLVYIRFDNPDWKIELMRELKAAGFEFEATKA